MIGTTLCVHARVYLNVLTERYRVRNCNVVGIREAQDQLKTCDINLLNKFDQRRANDSMSYTQHCITNAVLPQLGMIIFLLAFQSLVHPVPL